MSPAGQSNPVDSPPYLPSPPSGGAAAVSPTVPATVPAATPGSDTGAVCGSEASAIEQARIAATRALYMRNVQDRADANAGLQPDHVLCAIDREAMGPVGYEVDTTPVGHLTSSPDTPGVLNSAGEPYGTLDRDRQICEEYDINAQAAAADGPASASVAGFGTSVLSVGLPGQRQTFSSFFHLVFGLAYCEDVPLPGVLQTVHGGTATAAQVLTLPNYLSTCELLYPNIVLLSASLSACLYTTTYGFTTWCDLHYLPMCRSGPIFSRLWRTSQEVTALPGWSKSQPSLPSLPPRPCRT